MLFPKRVILTLAVLMFASLACNAITGGGSPARSPEPPQAVETQPGPSVEQPAEKTEAPADAPQATQAPQAPSVTAAPGGVDIKAPSMDILRLVFKNMAALKSYRMTQDATTGDVSSHIVIDRVGKDRTHMIVSTGEGVQTEFIIIADKFYMNGPDGKWIAAPNVASGMLNSLNSIDLTEKMLASVQDVKLVGPDTLDGKPMIVISYSTNMNNVGVQTKIWVGVADELPYKMETSGELNGKKFSNKVVFSDFNGDIKINSSAENGTTFIVVLPYR